jgi:uncharacterized protein YndB with AHSA1/START domain
MTTTTETSVRREVTVAVPVARAFEVFTSALTSWWPLGTHHVGEQDPVEAVLEPGAGGRLFERAADGSECDWGRVLTWEPPTRLVLAWHLNERWEFDPDPDKASEVEVRFVEEDGSTRVELEHRGFERHGAGAGAIRAAISAPNGWSGVLAAYRSRAEDQV